METETSFLLPWKRVQPMKVNPRKKKRTMTSKLTLDLGSASIVRLRRMKHIPTEGLVPWTVWYSEDNYQNHKHIRPVRRLCEYDEFGKANWEE